MERLVGETGAQIRRPGLCAVNNAGISGPRYTPMAEVTEEQWDRSLNVNLKGVWPVHETHEIQAMLASGGWRHRQHRVDLRPQAADSGPRALWRQQARCVVG
jgi:NAD(P)-dependent dehydrogenase (short-subunit alcohol dehydrogenase family)